MNLAKIAAKVALGFGIAARVAGLTVHVYRPRSAFSPTTGAPLSTLPCIFDQSKALADETPAGWGHPAAYLIINTTDVAAGDFIVLQVDPSFPNLQTDTYFVARFEPAKPPLAILTNAILSVLASDDPADDNLVGWQPPSGPTAATDVVLATGWPASMLAKTRGDTPAAHLPTDTRAAYFEVLVPAIPGLRILPGLRLKDATGQGYHVSTAELTPFGNRLLVITDST